MLSPSKPKRVVYAFDEKVKFCLAARHINNRLHIYRDDQREAIIVPPKIVTTFELHKLEDDHWHLWVAVQDGTIYRNSLHLTNHVSRNAYVFCSSSQKAVKENWSIFEDLLQDQHTPEKVQVSKMIWLSDNDAVMRLTGVVTHVCCGSENVCVSRINGDEISICVYSLHSLLSKKLGTALHTLLFPCPRNLWSSCMQPNSQDQLPLCFLATTEKAAVSSSQLVLPENLFSALFGTKSAIKSTPILMWGGSSGAVFYRPVDTAQSSSTEIDWHLLCHLECPVVNICSIKVKRALSEKEKMASELKLSLGLPAVSSLMDSFLVCGASGLCWILSTIPESDGITQKFIRVMITFTLPDVIQCCCSKGEILFFSTGHGIKRCNLTLTKDPEREEDKHRVHVECVSLHTASVSDMWLISDIRAQEDILLCQTSNGDIIAFDAKETGSDDGDSVASSDIQLSLQELLVSIDINSSKMGQLQARHCRLNSFLQQMNVASCLLLHHHHAGAISKDQSPVSCQVKVQSHVEYHRIQHFVVVTLVNNCLAALTSEWSVIIAIQECYGNNQFFSSDSASKEVFPSSSHTFALDRGLSSGQQASFQIPVSYLTFSTQLMVQVMMSLHFFKEMSNEKNMKPYECLFIPVHITILDVFDFLQVRETDSAVSVSSRTLMVDDYIDGLQHGRKISSENNMDSAAAQSYTIIEAVPDSFCKDFNIETPFSLLTLIASWTQMDGSALKPPLAKCSFQDPDNTPLSVFVEENLGETKTSSLISEVCPLRVIMKSSSMSLLAQARIALGRRLQSSTRVHKELAVGSVQKLIDRIEKLLQELKALRENFTEASQLSSQNISTAYNLYEKMRSLFQ